MKDKYCAIHFFEKIICAFLIVICITTSIAFPKNVYEAYATQIVQAPKYLVSEDNFNDEVVGKRIIFGNNIKKTKTWFIVGKEKVGDKTALVLLKDSTLGQSVFDGGYDFGYSDSQIAEKLNTTYYNTLFNKVEKTFVIPVTFYKGTEYENSHKLYLVNYHYVKYDYLLAGETSIVVPYSIWSNVEIEDNRFGFWLRSVSIDDEVHVARKSKEYFPTFRGDLEVDVVPACDINISSGLFASPVKGCSLNEKGTVVDSDFKMTVRFPATNEVSGNAIVNDSGITVTNAGENEYLYVQWNDGTNDRVYSCVANNGVISAEAIGGSGFYLTSDCKVWIEKNIYSRIYAKTIDTSSHTHKWITSSNRSKLELYCSNPGCRNYAADYEEALKNGTLATINLELSPCKYYGGEISKQDIFGEIDFSYFIENIDSELCVNSIKLYKCDSNGNKVGSEINSINSEGKYIAELSTCQDNAKKASLKFEIKKDNLEEVKSRLNNISFDRDVSWEQARNWIPQDFIPKSGDLIIYGQCAKGYKVACYDEYLDIWEPISDEQGTYYSLRSINDNFTVFGTRNSELRFFIFGNYELSDTWSVTDDGRKIYAVCNGECGEVAAHTTKTAFYILSDLKAYQKANEYICLEGDGPREFLYEFNENLGLADYEEIGIKNVCFYTSVDGFTKGEKVDSNSALAPGKYIAQLELGDVSIERAFKLTDYNFSKCSKNTTKITVDYGVGIERAIAIANKKLGNIDKENVYLIYKKNDSYFSMIYYNTSKKRWENYLDNTNLEAVLSHISEGAEYYVVGKNEQSEEIENAGWNKINGKWYYFDKNGVRVSGWQNISARWYYFDNDGVMQLGWQKIGNYWYYFGTTGAMQKEWKKINNVWYYFGSSGIMKTGWQKIGNVWYYFETSGAMVTKWKFINGYYYYFGSDGKMVAGNTIVIDGKEYRFANSGILLE